MDVVHASGVSARRNTVTPSLHRYVLRQAVVETVLVAGVVANAP